MTTAEKLYEVSGKLPPSALAELLDFAEFLRQRNSPPAATTLTVGATLLALDRQLTNILDNEKA